MTLSRRQLLASILIDAFAPIILMFLALYLWGWFVGTQVNLEDALTNDGTKTYKAFTVIFFVSIALYIIPFLLWRGQSLGMKLLKINLLLRRTKERTSLLFNIILAFTWPVSLWLLYDIAILKILVLSPKWHSLFLVEFSVSSRERGIVTN